MGEGSDISLWAVRGVWEVSRVREVPLLEGCCLLAYPPGVAVLAEEGSRSNLLPDRSQGAAPPGEIADSAIGVTPTPSMLAIGVLWSIEGNTRELSPNVVMSFSDPFLVSFRFELTANGGESGGLKGEGPILRSLGLEKAARCARGEDQESEVSRLVHEKQRTPSSG
jgi:hypothetical protein